MGTTVLCCENLDLASARICLEVIERDTIYYLAFQLYTNYYLVVFQCWREVWLDPS